MIRSRRMVLPGGSGEDAVADFAARLGYPMRSDIPADEENYVLRTVTWHADTGPIVNYREDILTGIAYTMFLADDSDELRGVVELAEAALHTWRVPELLEKVDASGDPESLVEAILMMGLGARRSTNTSSSCELSATCAVNTRSSPRRPCSPSPTNRGTSTSDPSGNWSPAAWAGR